MLHGGFLRLRCARNCPSMKDKLPRKSTTAKGNKFNMARSGNSRAWAIPLAYVLWASFMLHAQQNVGRITGVVRDPSGAVVPAADITATAVATGVALRVKANEGGSYSFPSLPTGEYKIDVRATGFKGFEQGGVQIVASAALVIDFQLELGQSTESVQVTGEAPKVDTGTVTEGNTIFTSQINELPLIMQGGARNASSFIGLLPGVIGGPGTGVATTTINGSQEGGVSYTLDGVIASTSGNSLMQDTFAHPPEAISEMRLNATNSSEYGSNGGVGVVLVSKSGTNKLHGNFYEYVRNREFNARNWFASQPDPSKQNEYGFTLGGPVHLPKIYRGKDKTFFFILYEGFNYRTQAGGSILTVPTAAMRAGNFSEWAATGITIYDPSSVVTNAQGLNVRLPFAGNIIPANRQSKVSSYFQSFFPLPNRPGLTNNWVGQLAASRFDSQKGSVKIDHNFRDGRQRLTFAFDKIAATSINPGNWTGPIATGSINDNPIWRSRLIYTASVGSNKVFNFRVGGNRTQNAFSGPPNEEALVGGAKAGYHTPFSDQTPSITIPSLGTIGTQVGGTVRQPALILPVNTDLSWLKGKHSFKFGASYVRNTTWFQNCFACAGQVTFSSGTTGNGLSGPESLGLGYASFMLGTPSFLTDYSPLNSTFILQAYGLYAQDSWRVTSKLTIDYGLRFDLLPMPREAYSRASKFDPGLPNPAAGGLLGALTFFGKGPGKNGQTAIANTQYPFAPHFGFAYALAPKTVIRGGYGWSAVNLLGLFQSGTQISLGNAQLGYQWQGVFQNQVTGISSPPYSWDSPSPLTPPVLPTIDPSFGNTSQPAFWDNNKLKAGRAQNINFGVEQELPGALLVKVGYVGNLAHSVPVSQLHPMNRPALKYQALGDILNQNITSPAAVAAGLRIPFPGFTGTVAQSLRPYPQFTNSIYNIADSAGFSLYHSFQATAQKRLGQGLTFLASYTISKQLSNYTSFGGAGEGYSSNTIQNIELNKTLKSLATNDRPQTLTISWVYDLPFGPGKKFLTSNNPVARQILGGWRVAGIHTYMSGPIIRVSTNRSDPTLVVVWANRNNNVPIKTSQGCSDYNPSNSAQNTYLNVGAFSAPAPYTYGNTATLSNVRGCANFSEDFSLQKLFTIHEHVRLLFSADAQNVLNRHQWTGLRTNIETPGFGQFTGATGPRLLQLHARLEF